MDEVVKLDELTSRREKLKVISMLGQEIIADTMQINKDRVANFLSGASTLMTAARDGCSQKWQSLKDGTRKTVANLAISAILAKDGVMSGIETVGKAVKQAPKEIGEAFVKSSRAVAKVGLQGAGLVVGGVVLGAQKVESGVISVASSVKSSVLSAQRKVRDVKNNTIDGGKAFVRSASKLMTTARDGFSQKWQSLKDGARKTVANLAISAILAKDGVMSGIETVGKTVKQAPKEIGEAFVKSSRAVAKVGLQGAGLVVGGVVLGAQKVESGVISVASSVKSSVLGAQRKVRDVKNNTIDGGKAFVRSASTLMTAARDGLSQKWQSLKDGVGNAWTSARDGVLSTKETIRSGVEAGVRAVKEVPQNVGQAMVGLGNKIADYSMQGAGLVVGGVVFGAQKASQFASDVKQGALDAALVASVGASLLSKKLEKEVAQVKADIAKGFVDGAQSVVLGGRNLANSVAQGYGDLKKGAKDTLVAMGEDIRNSNLVKEVKKGIEKSNENFMKGYNAALIGGGRG